MQQPATQRRLAAILAADTVGFSRMMGADEEGTLARLKAIRAEIVDPAIAEYRGRIFKTTGDGVLAEFPSVVDAVQCAVKVQIAMAARAEAADKRIVFRIGINLGDVIVEGDDLYGDGVNVAARLEGICDAGGVAISGNAHEQVRGKVTCEFLDRGEHRVKNIARPVRVYAPDLRAYGIVPRRKPLLTRRRAIALGLAAVLVLAAGIGTVVFERMKKNPDTAATIAVLPFANQSGDAKRDYFSDGVTEDITNALGRFSTLRVIAAGAVHGYKGRKVSGDEVGRELGVRYIVQGSVREAGGRLRVGVELSDAAKGTLLWSERYEGDDRELFQIQDRIVHNIAGALAVKLTALELQRVTAKPPESMEAYDLVLRARELLPRGERAGNREARMLLARAVQLSPGYAEAYAALAEGEFQRAVFGWIEDPQEALQRSEEAARQAIALGDAGAAARAHGVLGSVYSFTRRYDEALAEADLAIELNGSDAVAYGLRGGVLLWIGRLEESVAASETVRRLDPRLSNESGFNLALAYYLLRRYREAVQTAEATLHRTPEVSYLQAVRAAGLAQLGQADEARQAAALVKKFDPFFKVELAGKRLVDPAHEKLLQEGLRKAGL